MPFSSSPTTPAHLSLAERLDWLHQDLHVLGRRLREGLAHLVAQTVAGAIRDVLRTLLGGKGPGPEHHPDPPLLPSYRRGATLWDNQAGRAHTPWPNDRLNDPEEYLADEEMDQEDESSSLAWPPRRSQEPRQTRWRQALAVGLQATAWWLRCRTGRHALLAGLGLGLALALAVYLGGALGLSGASLAGSAFTLLALCDPLPMRSQGPTTL